MERERKMNNLTVNSMHNYNYACIFLFLYRCLASLAKKKTAAIFHYHFLPAAWTSWTRSCNVTKVCKTDCTIRALLPKLATKNNFLGNNSVQTWHYTRHFQHFLVSACYSAQLAFIHPLLLVQPASTMCCNLTENIEVHSCCTCVTLSSGLQNCTRHISNMKQLISDLQCQLCFVDDTVLIPKVNHKTTLHHDQSTKHW